MKRAIIAIFIFSITLCCYAENVVIAPFSGVFGVNIASTKYKGGTVWADYSLTGSDFKDPETQYTDDHMVATAGVFNSSSERNASYTISVSCPNGMYFRSQSNPNYVRPFKLILIPRFENAEQYDNGDFKPDFSGEARTLNGSGDSIRISYDDVPSGYQARYGNLWCDIILYMPLNQDPVAGTNYVISDGIQYPLIQAEDYTALVTITITSDTGMTDAIVIPFSGYYDGLPDSGKGDQLVSLMFTPSGNAANLNIISDANRSVQVGHIDFLLDSTENKGDSIIENTNDYVKIFFSSSNSPYDTTASEFMFVHSSVGPSTVLTNYNSIGYEITVAGEEQNGIGFRTFYGTDHLDPQTFDISNAIIPKHVVESGIVSISPRKREYYEYHGDINVIIDTPAGTMLPGRYSSIVYMHVVTEK